VSSTTGATAPIPFISGHPIFPTSPKLGLCMTRRRVMPISPSYRIIASPIFPIFPMIPIIPMTPPIIPVIPRIPSLQQ